MKGGLDLTKIVFNGAGMNMNALDLLGLFDYLDATSSTTAIRYFDDSFNYAEFTGTGLAIDANGYPTSGTVTGTVIVVDGVTTQSYSDFTIGAVELLGIAATNDVAALYDNILSGRDKITGSSHDDVLIGSKGNDIIRGRGGSDKIYGQTDNDTLRGDGGRDILSGSAGRDRLDGGLSADKMIGGTGADRFYFTTNLNRNIDRIADFAPGQDKIYLSDAIFTEAGPARQALSADAFVTSASGIPALDSSDRIIYDSSNGNLYYDPDGSGSADAIQFARLLNTAAISADDFMIV